MRRAKLWLILTAVVVVAAAVSLYSQGRAGATERQMPSGVAFRILLGVGDTDVTPWNGSIAASPGTVSSISGWRFMPADSTDGKSTWTCSTRRGAGNANNAGPIVPNGVIVTATSN